MEVSSRASTFSLIAICFAVALLVVVFVDLMRPQLPRLESVAGKSPVLQDNWFSERTFKLLTSAASTLEGVDASSDPFKRPGWAVAPADPELLPPVEPTPERPPPPPATREISLVYRGFYRSSSGEPFAYVEVDNAMQVYPINRSVAASWQIIEANATELILEHADEGRRLFPFNQKKSLEVPLQ